MTLSPDIVQRLFDEALAHGDEEVCGLIGARQNRACNVYPVANMARNRSLHFDMDGAEQISAMRLMRERGESLFAIYHSHPRSEAWPSATDIAQANYPDALYLIISLQSKTPELRGYYLHGEQVDECELHF